MAESNRAKTYTRDQDIWNEFGFITGMSTMEDNFSTWQSMEKYQEKRKTLHMDFIDLEKAYDREPKDLICKL